jgi:hypothetical protein
MLVFIITSGDAERELRELAMQCEQGGNQRALEGVVCEIMGRALLRRAEELVVRQEDEFWEDQEGEEPVP